MTGPAPLPAHLDELREALATATPGPWHVMRSNDERRAYAITGGRIITDSAGCSVADAALIVAAVNLAPSLLSLVREQADALEQVRALHRPWYEIHGVRHDYTVMANCEDFDGCNGTADRECDDPDDHERLACVECRHVFEDMDGNLFWPCPTARALLPDHGQPTDEEGRRA